MTPEDTMTLVEAAETAFTEYANAAEDQADEHFDHEREGFLNAARTTARDRLGDTADQLEWTYTPHAELPEDVEEATAPLAPGRPEYLRYRYYADDESGAFELVQPCSACERDRINEVGNLIKLGELLATKGGDQ
ncbi:hypothetical protein ACWDA7_38780 [Streptomyces sp. NPDC001156]